MLHYRKYFFYLFLFFGFFFIGLKVLERKIEKEVFDMSVFKLPQFIEEKLSFFYSNNGCFPNNIELSNFHNISYLSKEELNTLQKKTIIDPYSKNSHNLYYIKIEEKTGICCGYILLSAGIDGKIDNKIKVMECEDFSNNSLLLYDSEEYNLFDYFIGKKDLVYSYENKCDCEIKMDSSLYTIPLRWLD
jgi:hypothetical protein